MSTTTTSPTEFAQNAQEQAINTIKQTQSAVVDAVRAWATAVEKVTPETPSLPFATDLPSAQEIVQTSFKFAEQLLKAQQEFAEQLIAAAAPVLEPKTSGEPKSAAKKA